MVGAVRAARKYRQSLARSRVFGVMRVRRSNDDSPRTSPVQSAMRHPLENQKADVRMAGR